MTRELDDADHPFEFMAELGDRGDSVLYNAVNDALDRIETGDVRAKRHGHALADSQMSPSTTRGWVAVTWARDQKWAIAWSVIDDKCARIHAIAPTELS